MDKEYILAALGHLACAISQIESAQEHLHQVINGYGFEMPTKALYNLAQTHLWSKDLQSMLKEEIQRTDF